MKGLNLHYDPYSMIYDDAAMQTSPASTYHSRYSPKREAERHLEASLKGRHPSIIIIVGGGLNYISAVAHERFPHAVLVSLQPSADFQGQEVFSPVLSWNPSSTASIHDILGIAFSDNRLAAGVALVSWPPVITHYKPMADTIDVAIREALESASSDAATTAFWAARWLHNCVRFILASNRVSTLLPATSPIILACAGPSLSRTIPAIRPLREDVSLWALASAVPALLQSGLVPDLVVSTDPGFWNGAHLRQSVEQGLPLVLPPSSYAQAQILEGSNLIPLDTGLSFEHASLAARGCSGLQALPSGSSAGTALRLALSITSGYVAIAGLDLAAEGHKDHASPYAFDTLDTMAERRELPAYSARSNRVLHTFTNTLGSWRTSRAFSVYATSIGVPQADGDRVLRLGDSPVETSIPRGCIDTLSDARGIKPCIRYQESDYSMTVPDRRRAADTMLTMLADRAIQQVHEALAESRPVAYEASLLWKALAPRQSASFLADAARGEAIINEAKAIDASVRLAARLLSGAEP